MMQIIEVKQYRYRNSCIEILWHLLLHNAKQGALQYLHFEIQTHYLQHLLHLRHQVLAQMLLGIKLLKYFSSSNLCSKKKAERQDEQVSGKILSDLLLSFFLFACLCRLDVCKQESFESRRKALSKLCDKGVSCWYSKFFFCTFFFYAFFFYTCSKKKVKRCK